MCGDGEIGGRARRTPFPGERGLPKSSHLASLPTGPPDEHKACKPRSPCARPLLGCSHICLRPSLGESDGNRGCAKMSHTSWPLSSKLRRASETTGEPAGERNGRVSHLAPHLFWKKPISVVVLPAIAEKAGSALANGAEVDGLRCVLPSRTLLSLLRSEHRLCFSSSHDSSCAALGPGGGGSSFSNRLSCNNGSFCATTACNSFLILLK